MEGAELGTLDGKDEPEGAEVDGEELGNEDPDGAEVPLSFFKTRCIFLSSTSSPLRRPRGLFLNEVTEIRSERKTKRRAFIVN